MKWVRTLVLFDKGDVISSPDWETLHQSYVRAIAAIDHPAGSGTLTLRQKTRRGKNQWVRNGVGYLRQHFLEFMQKTEGWKSESNVDLARSRQQPPVILYPSLELHLSSSSGKVLPTPANQRHCEELHRYVQHGFEVADGHVGRPARAAKAKKEYPAVSQYPAGRWRQQHVDADERQDDRNDRCDEDAHGAVHRRPKRRWIDHLVKDGEAHIDNAGRGKCAASSGRAAPELPERRIDRGREMGTVDQQPPKESGEHDEAKELGEELAYVRFAQRHHPARPDKRDRSQAPE